MTQHADDGGTNTVASAVPRNLAHSVSHSGGFSDVPTTGWSDGHSAGTERGRKRSWSASSETSALPTPSGEASTDHAAGRHRGASRAISDAGHYGQYETESSGGSSNGQQQQTGFMTFPQRLQQILNSEGPDVIAWKRHGQSFDVKDKIMDVLPKYFRQTKIQSFQRQLNLYGFTRLTKGPDAGSYYHALFRRDRPDLVKGIKRSPGQGARATAKHVQDLEIAAAARGVLLPSIAEHVQTESPSQSAPSTTTPATVNSRGWKRHAQGPPAGLGPGLPPTLSDPPASAPHANGPYSLHMPLDGMSGEPMPWILAKVGGQEWSRATAGEGTDGSLQDGMSSTSPPSSPAGPSTFMAAPPQHDGSAPGPSTAPAAAAAEKRDQSFMASHTSGASTLLELAGVCNAALTEGFSLAHIAASGAGRVMHEQPGHRLSADVMDLRARVEADTQQVLQTRCLGSLPLPESSAHKGCVVSNLPDVSTLERMPSTRVLVVALDPLEAATLFIRRGDNVAMISSPSSIQTDLCRRSDLLDHLQYWGQTNSSVNQAPSPPMYHPSVIVFRGIEAEGYADLHRPVAVDVVSVPDLTFPPSTPAATLREAMMNAIRMTLTVATGMHSDMEHRNTVLIVPHGWWCPPGGAPAEEAAAYFREVLSEERNVGLLKTVAVSICGADEGLARCFRGALDGLEFSVGSSSSGVTSPEGVEGVQDEEPECIEL